MTMTEFLSSAELLAQVENEEALSLVDTYLMRNYGSPKDVVVSGNGSYLRTASGREILDFVSGIAVCSLGHAPDVVAEAISEQSHKLIHTSNYFANEIAPKVAFLIDTLIRGTSAKDDNQGRVFFSNSGAESVEAAIKLARRIKGPSATKVVALNGAFHGRTLGALSATGQPSKQIAFEPLVPGFIHVDDKDIYAVETAFKGGDVCAFITEPILGEAGIYPTSSDFIHQVHSLCQQYGVLFIVDEVQCGFGRTGTWFAHQRWGILPDIITLAKSIASGYPVGATWARGEYGRAFLPGDHGSTFGGSPLAMASALATISALIDADACGMATTMGKLLRDGLSNLDGVKEIRGEGLLLGVELEDSIAGQLGEMTFARGLFVNVIGDYILRLAPPLTVNAQEIEHAISIISDCLSTLRYSITTI